MFVAQNDRNSESGDTAGRQRQVRVYHRPLLAVSWCFDGVEARPVEPQEDGPDHGEEVGRVSGFFQGVVFGFRGPESEDCAHGQTEVGAEGVHEDRATGVGHLRINIYSPRDERYVDKICCFVAYKI